MTDADPELATLAWLVAHMAEARWGLSIAVISSWEAGSAFSIKMDCRTGVYYCFLSLFSNSDNRAVGIDGIMPASDDQVKGMQCQYHDAVQVPR